MGMIVHGVISQQFMGLRILVPFAGPLRNASAAWSSTSKPRSTSCMAEGKTVPAYFQTTTEKTELPEFFSVLSVVLSVSVVSLCRTQVDFDPRGIASWFRLRWVR
jgi:hypothetical protein